MDWFRVYSSILDKPNVCGLDAEALGYWVLFLAVANRNCPRGTLPADPKELAWAIHKDAVMVARMVDTLVGAGLLLRDGDVIRFHKWNLYQPPSTDRSNSSKEAKKERDGDAATSCNIPQHLATRDNIGQQSATSGNILQPMQHKREEREEREEKPPPTPPTGGLTVGGSISLPPETGRHSLEAIQLETWANEHCGVDPSRESYGFWARSMCDSAPASWVRALLERHARGRSGAGRKSIAYLGSILGKWVAAGSCEYLDAAAARLAKNGKQSAPAPLTFVAAPPDFPDPS